MKIATQIQRCKSEWYKLIVGLKKQIGDDYRASEEDTRPSMCLTVGFTPRHPEYDKGILQDYSWNYQTGDNSYSGGAYGHPHWGVISIYRNSNSKDLANDLADQIGDLLAQSLSEDFHK